MTIMLNGSDLTVTQVVAAARYGEAVALAPAAIAAMGQARAVVQEVLSQSEPVYGLTTGVGERKAFLLDPAERHRFNHRLVLNHRIAQGEVAPADVVRGAMLCLANSYAKGVTGVRPELAEMIITLLNEGFAPPVRRLGSIGQADLGPFAASRTSTARPGTRWTTRGTSCSSSSNSSQSNPVVVVPERRIVSVGNFDIGPLAAALDFARIALAPVVTSANERAVKLLQAPFSGLPAGLSAIAGSPDDALSELAVAGQAITVEARTLAHPVSYELASSVKGEGIEDRATMAPLSARRLADMSSCVPGWRRSSSSSPPRPSTCGRSPGRASPWVSAWAPAAPTG